MDIYTETTLLITCAPGLSPWLSGELAQLGYNDSVQQDRAVELRGTLVDAIRLNLHALMTCQFGYQRPLTLSWTLWGISLPRDDVKQSREELAN